MFCTLIKDDGVVLLFFLIGFMVVVPELENLHKQNGCFLIDGYELLKIQVIISFAICYVVEENL